MKIARTVPMTKLLAELKKGPEHPEVSTRTSSCATSIELVGGSLEERSAVVDLLERGFQLGPDLVALAGDPADDEGDGGDDQRQGENEDESGPEPPRHVPPLESVGQGHQDGREHCGDRQRDGHVRDEGDEEQHQGEHTGDSQHEPGADAQGPEPRCVSKPLSPRCAAAATLLCGRRLRQPWSRELLEFRSWGIASLTWTACETASPFRIAPTSARDGAWLRVQTLTSPARSCCISRRTCSGSWRSVRTMSLVRAASNVMSPPEIAPAANSAELAA